jgi:hypothetical protein
MSSYDLELVWMERERLTPFLKKEKTNRLLVDSAQCPVFKSDMTDIGAISSH